MRWVEAGEGWRKFISRSLLLALQPRRCIFLSVSRCKANRTLGASVSSSSKFECCSFSIWKYFRRPCVPFICCATLLHLQLQFSFRFFSSFFCRRLWRGCFVLASGKKKLLHERAFSRFPLCFVSFHNSTFYWDDVWYTFFGFCLVSRSTFHFRIVSCTRTHCSRSRQYFSFLT